MRTTDVVIKIIIITVIITLTRDWSRVYAKTISFIEVHKHYTESNLKQQPEEKKLKTVGYNTTYHRQLYHEWTDGRY